MLGLAKSSKLFGPWRSAGPGFKNNWRRSGGTILHREFPYQKCTVKRRVARYQCQKARAHSAPLSLRSNVVRLRGQQPSHFLQKGRQPAIVPCMSRLPLTTSPAIGHRPMTKRWAKCGPGCNRTRGRPSIPFCLRGLGPEYMWGHRRQASVSDWLDCAAALPRTAGAAPPTKPGPARPPGRQ